MTQTRRKTLPPPPMPPGGAGDLRTIGKRLRYARLAQGMTVETLSQLSGLSRAAIDKLEADRMETHGPGVLTLEKVCATLKISRVWLISGVGQMYVEPTRYADIPGWEESERLVLLRIKVADSHMHRIRNQIAETTPERATEDLVERVIDLWQTSASDAEKIRADQEYIAFLTAKLRGSESEPPRASGTRRRVKKKDL